jgi:hypothetical protein
LHLDDAPQDPYEFLGLNAVILSKRRISGVLFSSDRSRIIRDVSNSGRAVRVSLQRSAQHDILMAKSRADDFIAE